MQPSNPSEESLLDAIKELRRETAKGHTDYKDLGLEYHSLALATRHNDNTRMSTVERVTTRFGFEQPEPMEVDFVSYAETLAKVVDLAHTAVRAGAMKRAERLVGHAKIIFVKLAAIYSRLASAVNRLAAIEAERPAVEETVDEKVEHRRLARLWILRLPEVKKAIELGIATEEEAMQMTLQEEERVVEDT